MENDQNQIRAIKGTFLLESTDVFGITYDEHFSFLKLKIWNLVVSKAALASQRSAFLPLQASKLSNFKDILNF